jgi:hypothetical protein
VGTGRSVPRETGRLSVALGATVGGGIVDDAVAAEVAGGTASVEMFPATPLPGVACPQATRIIANEAKMAEDLLHEGIVPPVVPR